MQRPVLYWRVQHTPGSFLYQLDPVLCTLVTPSLPSPQPQGPGDLPVHPCCPLVLQPATSSTITTKARCRVRLGASLAPVPDPPPYRCWSYVYIFFQIAGACNTEMLEGFQKLFKASIGTRMEKTPDTRDTEYIDVCKY